MNTRLARGEFSSNRFDVSGTIGTRFADNGDVSTTAGRITAATDSHRVSLVTEIDTGNDLSTPEGKIRPSGLRRDRYDLSYAYGGENTQFMIYGGRLDTTDTGTPALPMDIRFIETDLYGGAARHASFRNRRYRGSLFVQRRRAPDGQLHAAWRADATAVPAELYNRFRLAVQPGQRVRSRRFAAPRRC